MDAKPTHNNNTTKTEGLQPGTALQNTAFKGETKTVILNGSKITMVHDGVQWWNVKVQPA